MKKTIILVIVFMLSFSGMCFAGDDVKAATPAAEETEKFSLPQAISSIDQSNFNIENLFALIADIVDIAAGNGESTSTGNIIRAVGSLISALIIKDEAAAKDANSALMRELILADDNLAQLSTGTIWDIYELCRDELTKRGVIEAEKD